MKSNFLILIIKILRKYVNLIEYTDNNEIYIYTSRINLLNLIKILKKSIFFQFKSLVDLTAIDYLWKKYRFHIIYNLLSYFYNFRIFLVLPLYITYDLVYGIGIPSLIQYYNSANWLEREVWDLFGLFFDDHIDLRRILTDYGFIGFPLRKDFPLSGFIEIRYDENLKQIVMENLKLTQEYRNYSFINPWIIN